MSKRIVVFCEQFYTFSGDKILMGGGERWLCDVVSLLKQMNFDVDVFQFSHKKFSNRYGRMTIKGIGNIENLGRPMDYWQKGYDEFKKISEDYDGVFLLSMNMAHQKYNKPTLTVSHGLMVDGYDPHKESKPMREVYDTMDAFKRWIKNVDSMLSVDSNTIKLSHVVCRELSHKLTYIPNYVDLEVFKPTQTLNDGKFRILFCRRLQFCRGFQTMMKATEEIISKYDNVIVNFVGRGNEAEEKFFMDWYNQQPKDKVAYTSYEMADVYKAYENCNISVVATTYAEGTSLSVLESLASGIPVITTVVGGLTDLVMDGVNGYLINPDYSQSYTDPDTTELIAAIEDAINNPEKLAEMRENALRMIKAFDKKRWEKQISEAIVKVYGEPNA